MVLFGGAKKKRRRRKKREPIKTMDVILVIVGVTMLVFTARMIKLFEVYGAVPDTLILSFFGFLGGECGIMGWIKTTKERKQDREWQKEDRRSAKKEAKKTATDPSKEERNDL